MPPLDKPCQTRKRRFRTEIDARIALDSIRRNSTREVKPTRTYRCHLCGGHHLTSKPKGRVQR